MRYIQSIMIDARYEKDANKIPSIDMEGDYAKCCEINVLSGVLVNTSA